MPKSTSAGIRVIQSRNAGTEELPQRDRIVVAWDGGDEALVEVDALELDPAPRVAVERVPGRPLDRLDVEDRDDGGQVRHVRLGQHGARQDRLATEAALLVLVGVAGGAEEAVAELAREPVGAARAERHRRAHGLMPADRLVAQPALGRQA